MEAIILAGGFGTRLRKVVPDLPKPMSPIGGRPFLEILLASLARKGFQRVVLSLGYKAEKIVDYFGGEYSGIELIYEIERSPLGTGGAIRQAMSRCIDDHVFAFNGDTFLDLEVLDVEHHWKQNHAPIIVVCKVENTFRYGRIEIEDGKVLTFSEKGVVGPGFINAGCYVLPINILHKYQQGVPFSMEEDFLMEAVREQRFNIFETSSKFIDIGIPEDYIRAQNELLEMFD